MKEKYYRIKNVTETEIETLRNANTNIEWYYDDAYSSEIYLYGTQKDYQTIIKIINRR